MRSETRKRERLNQHTMESARTLDGRKRSSCPGLQFLRGDGAKLLEGDAHA